MTDIIELRRQLQIVKDTYKRFDPSIVAVELALNTAQNNQPQAIDDVIFRDNISAPTVEFSKLNTRHLRHSLSQALKALSKSKHKKDPLLKPLVNQLIVCLETGSMNQYLIFFEQYCTYTGTYNTAKNPERMALFSGGFKNNSGNLPSQHRKQGSGFQKGGYIAEAFSTTAQGERDATNPLFKVLGRIGNEQLENPGQGGFEGTAQQLWKILSSLLATLAQGPVICFIPQGVRADSIFWFNELPVLRRLQLTGQVTDIYMYVQGAYPDFIRIKEAGQGFASQGQYGQKGMPMKGKKFANKWYGLTTTLWGSHPLANAKSKVGRPLISKPVSSLNKKMREEYEQKNGVAGNLDIYYGPKADVFMRWLVTHTSNKNKALTFYAYRLEASIMAHIGNSNPKQSLVELRQIGYSDTFKAVYAIYKDENERAAVLQAIEKYLIANCRDWGLVPNALLSTRKSLWLHDGQLQLIALYTNGAWRYVEQGIKFEPKNFRLPSNEKLLSDKAKKELLEYEREAFKPLILGKRRVGQIGK